MKGLVSSAVALPCVVLFSELVALCGNARLKTVPPHKVPNHFLRKADFRRNLPLGAAGRVKARNARH